MVLSSSYILHDNLIIDCLLVDKKERIDTGKHRVIKCFAIFYDVTIPSALFVFSMDVIPSFSSSSNALIASTFSGTTSASW